MNHIVIIGGGFSGTMTAVRMVEKSSAGKAITLISEKETLNRGIAFNPYSDKHLLNVVAGKMSAYSDKPDHFMDWVMRLPSFANKDRNLISQSFLPRRIYGDYLTHIWNQTLTTAKQKGILIQHIEARVAEMDVTPTGVVVVPELGAPITADACVIATGNHIPGNPRISNTAFFKSKLYFQDPWKEESVSNLPHEGDVLIVGNGLTMVDTVLGLLEKGFRGTIHAVSPNGFNILPHRHPGMVYPSIEADLQEHLTLLELVHLVNRHVKSVREHGISAEPVIDALRPFTQILWQRFTTHEKKQFMSRLRHLWGVARHRIPLHTHDKIQQLRIDGRLRIAAGKLIDLEDQGTLVKARFVDKRTHTATALTVNRVINCTGPETDLLKMDSFLRRCLQNGILYQDDLKLGIQTDPQSLQVLQPNGVPHERLFTLGSNLKGILWESTAVSELREQADRLAAGLTRLTSAVPAGK